MDLKSLDCWFFEKIRKSICGKEKCEYNFIEEKKDREVHQENTIVYLALEL